ncbi:MAG TPA: 23S rRNA (uracil(1939)-C(5))-methyltransferase RlmD [Elusimicrobia bacterium]|nr:MAG: 23S rRNA (uracil-5-)-methyltransferase RumA [Elusimicrobia bacterium RIFOXYA12_FULL_49_49]OGS09931.1 MAG: 23S rRNA (uracil-5-)-methyltransferase RumA [Elusimicrobia bacterium RIFOXYB1_FULL_48_9]OGS15823.1 MAG: 23S rRNA (uracil-5-)-methyltransferase RumA [Elusimicrobia bacterium RIFOXYA2_FULL_47_53]OGS31155.1 MAG: 23S rRNA (uracil-5-)-methyltransferase RumA [Elusimicrobia bacterium RIFOXYB2_FULL_46_23]HBU69207.1 23S rRNA (uracil(1939)-C(5))-methyltransferase RlmD [Elusimicrobiota bacteri
MKSTVKVEKIVYPGKALARGEDGTAVFFDGALPGETAEVKIIKSKKSFKEAILLSVLSASPIRRAPVCPSFGFCGGCSFQHTGYANQLEIKRSYVCEQLKEYEPLIGATVPSPEELGYRNKMEFSFFAQDGRLLAGLHVKKEFNRYVPVPPCFIADKDTMSVFDTVMDFAQNSGKPVYDKKLQSGFYRHLVLRKAKRSSEVLVNIVTNKDGAVSAEFFAPLVKELGNKAASVYWTVNSRPSDAVYADELTLLSGAPVIHEKLIVKNREYGFNISPFSFFQTNTYACEKLYETVVDIAPWAKTDRVLDLYCGTGTIGLVLAPCTGRVYGVEQIPDAVKNARENSLLNKIENIEFVEGSVENWVKLNKELEFDSLVVDPPRSGLTPKIIEFITAEAPAKIVYVSCNPSTLARDLKAICLGGRYEVVKIVPVDMFPQTFHVETVVYLKRA